ncbi:MULTISPECIES: protein phosphatase 2C domain-containing protein [unclassified Crossiella]|uniref:protein phosphatase 2C domain-containing protein n=1 Tax=unclassified Crossiella TaxID=2620835 RepID=UPI001FFF7583|nr:MULTISPECIES: protein phosphatase 2C domain-containing protein [unclassified Crossiella]MCK2243809.1 protein phosphatase 2C domain-containing protein [Crossiella sp. S99.2]MCK2257668.1 protein phosphatase 2C domain-containing protein [Crossiella sp. S99.1]
MIAENPVHIHATTGHTSAWWHHEQNGRIALSLWTERIPGQGEDAPPLSLHNLSGGRGLLAVCDGAGGAGAFPLGRAPGGVPRSHAWVAARATRGLIEEWFADNHKRHFLGSADRLRDHLAHRLSRLTGSAVRTVRGTLCRDLPTTLAAIEYQTRAGDLLSWRAFWAGDSRCFLLTPAHGLQQLTTDDTARADAFQALSEDPPMTNMVCVDRPFRVSAADCRAALPCVLLCATDGCFGQVGTPAEFEHILLASLAEADSTEEWARLLVSRLTEHAVDDTSLVLSAFGFAGYQHLRQALTPRHQRLIAEHVNPLRTAPGPTVRAAQAESWRRYREAYEHLLPHRRPEPL